MAPGYQATVGLFKSEDFMRAAMLIGMLSACGGWTRTDTVLEITSQVTLAADWYTTETAKGLGLGEENPIIGPNHDRVPPAIYFPVTGALHLALSAALPPRWRNAFQGATIGVQTKVVLKNLEHIEMARKLRD